MTEATIEADQPLRFHVDGEPRQGGTSLRARVHPGALFVSARLPEEVARLRGEIISFFEASMVDAANPVVFLDAAALGLKGTEMPEWLDAHPDLVERVATIRRHASVAMGIAKTIEKARGKSMPQIGFVSAPQDATTLSGEALPASGLAGPAIVSDAGATLWVAPGWRARRHASGAVVVTRGGRS